ncbi:MAG: STY4526/YPO1902 family pathogenicity island replication protein [Methylococcales bacterium]
MESPGIKFKKELSRTFSRMLTLSSTASRQGELDISNGIGFTSEQVMQIEALSSDQLDSVAEKYIHFAKVFEFISIDNVLLANILNLVSSDADDAKLIDEMLTRGACGNMMREFFKFRSTQVANRRILLNITPINGRITHLTLEDEEAIYKFWMANIDIEDVRFRMIAVNEETGISLAHIYRSVKELDRNKIKSNQA